MSLLRSRPGLRVAVLGGGKVTPYSQKIINLFGSAIIAYWPLNDAAGPTILDASGNGRNAATGGATGPTLGVAGIGDGKTAVSFPGSAAFVNAYSTSLRDAFNGAEGSAMAWATCAALSGSDDEYLAFAADASNRVIFGRTGTNHLFAYYKAATVSEYYSPIFAQNGWYHLALTWSKSNERTRLYLNGALWGSTATLGIWAGTLLSTQSIIGALNSSASETWNGKVAHALLLNREATAAEIRRVAAGGRNPLPVAVLGDSISAWGSAVNGWTERVRDGHLGGNVMMFNHAVSGQSIAAHLAAQVAAASTDNANIIILQLGTNDDNAGNMTALQTTVETAIDDLHSAHPNATIYYMNVLPRWTNNTTGPEVAKGNIRAAITAACAAKSVTCWDTYTTPWILQSDTNEGLHPNDAGYQKIGAQILARL